ncbi:LacI family DNA-binding transcriptional regulator [Cohnella hashimotonis]|uniref:LacI family DNA-binding transcriptional regulator n=1 Tax=Cohnella hashimotonis TaxID=2826895 RepID=A0ABT6TEX9_9BACL|nr:LacI family DNA-binding transcriptional regulator [Cohnella hashimotonis]MDI4645392.1 LacI family DNA-binding transcriptional regulator [Cohnella hashimotonis]
MIGLKEIAEIANVSISTVSNVLNGRKNVGEETRERVLRICEEHGYAVGGGKKARTEKNRTVLFIFSDFDRDFYLKIIQGISDCLTENGFNLVICTNKSSGEFMRGSFAGGAICLDASMSDEFLAGVAAREMPVVLMDRIMENGQANAKSVVVDNYPVMCQLVQSLADRGIKRFGYVGGLGFTLDNQERFAGFSDTLARNGIVFDQRYYYHGNYREDSGYQAAKLMLLSNDLPEVVVCANDNMALGAVKAFEEHGVKVPEDVSVTGFDDSAMAAMAGLTTVAIPRYESGYLAAKKLLELMGDEEASVEPFKLSATIRWRRTVK